MGLCCTLPVISFTSTNTLRGRPAAEYSTRYISITATEARVSITIFIVLIFTRRSAPRFTIMCTRHVFHTIAKNTNVNDRWPSQMSTLHTPSVRSTDDIAMRAAPRYTPNRMNPTIIGCDAFTSRVLRFSTNTTNSRNDASRNTSTAKAIIRPFSDAGISCTMSGLRSAGLTLPGVP